MRGTMTLNVSSQLSRPLLENCENIRATRYFTLLLFLTCARFKKARLCNFSARLSHTLKLHSASFPIHATFSGGCTPGPVAGDPAMFRPPAASVPSVFTHLSESYSNRHLNGMSTIRQSVVRG